MNKKQESEALRLAEIIGGNCAAELRRLHAEVEHWREYAGEIAEVVDGQQKSIASAPSRRSGSQRLVEVLLKIDESFEQKLQAKTGWGKNEVLAQYRSAVLETLLELQECCTGNPP